jgi:hypothetical protein
VLKRPVGPAWSVRACSDRNGEAAGTISDRMNRARLEATLRETFDPSPGALRVVVRQATDLDDDGRYETDTGRALTAEVVVEGLGDAPDESLVDRWNWWLGSLEFAYGDYAEFQVQGYRPDE